MRVRQLTSDGDMRFGHQQYDFYRDIPEAPAQCVQTRLMFWQGEWYLDLTDGTPYQGGVLGTNTELTADSVIRDRILNTRGVTGIAEGSYNSQLDRATRRLSAACTVDTAFGLAEVTI
jgi:hypothetical protein